MLLYVKRTRRIFEKAKEYYEDAFRLNVAKIVLKRLKKVIVHGDSWCITTNKCLVGQLCLPECGADGMSRESLNSLAKELRPHVDVKLLSNALALYKPFTVTFPPLCQ